MQIHDIPQGDLNRLAYQYFGFIQCTVESPNKLLHPVLPLKINGKLMFPLCQECAVSQHLRCPHGRKTLSGTWFTGEIQYAIECGYKIIHVDLIEHYPSKRKSPYYDFIRYCIDQKEQAERENNAPRRSIAKLCANSFWGKLATNNDGDSVIYIRSEKELYNLFADSTKKIKDVMDLGTSCRVTFSTDDNFKATPKYTSLASACMVTSYARLVLLKHIHSLIPENVLYFDTDSVIFIHKPGDPFIQNIGEECGQMANELKEGSHITCFASSGPKSYAYIVQHADGTTSAACKIKGITLNEEALSTLGAQQLYNVFFSFIQANYQSSFHQIEKLSLTQFRISVDRQSTVYSHNQIKEFGNIYNKRFIIDNFETRPWGYNHEQL